jgi:Flp pilus assembly pilin Flp
LKSLFSRWHRDWRGQDLLEYALVGAFIAMVVLAGATDLGASVNDWFDAVAGVTEDGSTKSHCGAKGMESSHGKCHGA